MFEWSSVLELAEELARRDATGEGAEAAWRAAASRAYFAAYNSAKDYLEDLERWTPPRADSHQELFRCLERLTGHSKMHRQLAAILTRLRHTRNRADYDREPSLRQDAAKTALLDAKKAFGLVDSLRTRRVPE
ncbi:MAG: HEPN domain-containing protein [Myxococcales bacterium]|nr:HEPN domain-containing protein [Myxococcales bacterium]MCB9703265.1 HEPN domain-containing protein [Myxococcales bacterium]